MIRDLARAALDWLDDDPLSFALTMAGAACLVALVVVIAAGGLR